MQTPLKTLPASLRTEQAIAFLRMATGLFYLYVGWQKVSNPQFAVGLASQLPNWAAQNPFFWYQDLLNYLLIPNAPYLAPVVGWGEVLVGTSFLLGLCIQYAAPVALFMNLNYLLASQHTGTALGINFTLGINLAFMAIAFTLFWSQAGQAFGLDYWIFRQEPGGASSSKPRTKGKASATGKKKKKAPTKVQQLKTAKVVATVRKKEFVLDDEDED